jgi:60 kDa SS-A/Ro ribonucleoprotein
MKNYSNDLIQTPQTQPIPGKTMVKNNAGGYSFAITSQELLERFLTIGSEKGTYYVDQKTLTIENATKVINYIKTDGLAVLNTVVDFLKNKKAPKADAGIFTLALLASYGTADVKKATYAAIPIPGVLNTATHLFMFIANVQNLRGWSRGLRTAVAKWYTLKEPKNLEYQVVKYRNRVGFTHRDVIRLAHPSSALHNYIFEYLTKEEGTVQEDTLLAAFEQAQMMEGKNLADFVREYKLTWEMVPTEQVNNPFVLEALLENMPLFAVLRNLNRFAYNGLTNNGFSKVTKSIVSKLSKENVIKSKVHPVTLLNAVRVYSAGRGDLGTKTWVANQNIVDALNNAFYAAIEGLTPTNKSILVAVDVSGSMSSATVNHSKLTPKDVSAALSMSIMRSEPNAELMWFDTQVMIPKIGRRNSLDEILRATPNGGGTNCSLAIKYALHTKNKYDAIVILTDNETWAGKSHASQELDLYRKINPNVKVIEIGMAANSISNYGIEDKNVLRVAGFDSTVAEVLNKFVSGS